MTRFSSPRLRALKSAALDALALAEAKTPIAMRPFLVGFAAMTLLQACAAISVVGAAGSVAASGVSAAASVASTGVSVAASGVSAGASLASSGVGAAASLARPEAPKAQ